MISCLNPSPPLFNRQQEEIYKKKKALPLKDLKKNGMCENLPNALSYLRVYIQE